MKFNWLNSYLMVGKSRSWPRDHGDVGWHELVVNQKIGNIRCMLSVTNISMCIEIVIWCLQKCSSCRMTAVLWLDRQWSQQCFSLRMKTRLCQLLIAELCFICVYWRHIHFLASGCFLLLSSSYSTFLPKFTLTSPLWSGNKHNRFETLTQCIEWSQAMVDYLRKNTAEKQSAYCCCWLRSPLFFRNCRV